MSVQQTIIRVGLVSYSVEIHTHTCLVVAMWHGHVNIYVIVLKVHEIIYFFLGFIPMFPL